MVGHMGKLGRAGQTYNGKKKGSKDGVEGLSKELLLVRGVPVKIVGHEENVGSRWDEGMARFHNLKAQETEGTHQFSWKSKAGKEDVTTQYRAKKAKLIMYYNHRVDVLSEKGVLGNCSCLHIPRSSLFL